MPNDTQNHFTRTIMLWLANDEPTYRYWTEAADQAWQSQDPDDRGHARKNNARWDLSRRLKQELDNDSDESSNLSPMYADLLTSALQEVDWDAVATDLLESITEVAELDD